MSPAIMLVEDEEELAKLAEAVLENAGFAVTVCPTAAKALEKLKPTRPDLILLDVGLPDTDGIGLCRMLRVAVGPELPILFLTSRNEPAVRLAAFNAGAQDYVLKPFAPDELLARIRVHLKIKTAQEKLARENAGLNLVIRARQDMVDMIIHNLKTPISSIQGTLDMIRDGGLISEGSYKTIVQSARSDADFMVLTLNDLLDISRGDRTSLAVRAAEFDLRTLLDRLRDLSLLFIYHSLAGA